MDMSDFDSAPGTAARGVDAADRDRLRALVGEIGAAIAGPLTSALERVVALTSSGRIDRPGLRALREEIERARQVGIESQQLARLASGRVRQCHEPVALPAMLAGVLAHRAREIQARGIDIRLQPARAVDVMVDAPLLFSLLNTLLDWALDCARSTIDLQVELKPAWPSHARLTCQFAHRPVDQLDDGAATPGETSLLDSMHWRLLQQTAQAMGLALTRSVDVGGTALALEFARTVNATLAGASAVELDQGFAPGTNLKPLAGSHVLVLAATREVRSQVREALRDMGLIVDFVASVDEAQAFCRDGLPHAIVVETALCDERFADLRRDIAADAPQFAFIEIVDDGRAFQVSGFGAAGMARIGREVMVAALPSALLFELARAQ